MASLFRVGVCRFVGKNGNNLLLKNDNPTHLLRTITSKTMMKGDRPKKPEPYPYNTKKYGFLKSLIDRTTPRMDENSKLLVVEGPIAAGKSKFAQELAKEMGMLYLPEANLDMYYINDYGFDLRTLDNEMPEGCKSFDVMDFMRNPQNMLTARMQLEIYEIKFSQYIDALAHILSTGQGVVLDRCVLSDYVFTEAMYSSGYLSKRARRKYYEYRDNTVRELLRPHLVIYLDMPVKKVMENVQKRGISWEKNSPVITPKYLECMEKVYKQEYLKTISTHSELLVYDWSEQGEVEIIIEDIERIDFDNYDYQDPKMKDWDLAREEDWNVLRRLYADQKEKLMSLFNIPCYEVPELMIEAEDADRYYQVLQSAPGMKYDKGYNVDQGDQGVLLKSSNPPRNTLPLRERRQL
ncbi:unnamed protein product [Brassicogethes aeneus]|uniref:NADH dehydrogenase [ubiquinone] 1 alpha subcomplex subunit 10, mitochondrial n=1 Tax=Brassicogethes aeneus TaxID=1431903 RepID=A0A9P0BGD3_BRAAE|nr:unnamed protein product [Brassicogethes aeneus]